MSGLAATHGDFLVAGLIAGILLTLLGIGALWLVRSVWGENPATEEAVECEPIDLTKIPCAHRRVDTALPFRCTRHLGHPGDHVAKTAHDHFLARWSNADHPTGAHVVPIQRTGGSR